MLTDKEAKNDPAYQQVMMELRAAQNLVVAELHLSALATITVAGNLQLALRHPGNVGASAKIVEAVVEALIESLRPWPAMHALAGRGRSVKRDVKVERVNPGEASK